jgi:hypothetical protein
MDSYTPVIYVVHSETGEATGEVFPYCSFACRDKKGVGIRTDSGFHPVAGIDTQNQFVGDGRCSCCGKVISV